MRKVIVSMMMSADGFIEGENHDLNWHVFDDEVEDYMTGFIETVDTFLYGRKSYELMLNYWPGATGRFADLMNKTPKIIFSKTLETVEWNSRLVKDNIAGEISKLKKQEGKDIVLFAGANLLQSFIDLDLVDEYRLIVNPVAIGSGTPLFKDLKKNLKFKPTEVKSFKCGDILLIYSAVRN